MAGGEHGPSPAEDHDADLIVGLGAEEGVIELHQEPSVLRVPDIGAVEEDPSDAAVVE